MIARYLTAGETVRVVGRNMRKSATFPLRENPVPFIATTGEELVLLTGYTNGRTFRARFVGPDEEVEVLT